MNEATPQQPSFLQLLELNNQALEALRKNVDAIGDMARRQAATADRLEGKEAA